MIGGPFGSRSVDLTGPPAVLHLRRRRDGIDEEKAIRFLPQCPQHPSVRPAWFSRRRLPDLRRGRVLPASRQIKSNIPGILPDLRSQPSLSPASSSLPRDRIAPLRGKDLPDKVDAFIGRTEDIGLLQAQRAPRLTSREYVPSVRLECRPGCGADPRATWRLR